MSARSSPVSDGIPMQGVEETDVQWITPVAVPTPATAATTTEIKEKPLVATLAFTDYKDARAYADTYLDMEMALDAAEVFRDASDARLEELKQNEKDIRKERTQCSRALPRIGVNASYWGPIAQNSMKHVQKCIRLEEELIRSTEERIKELDSLLGERVENHRAAQFLLSQKRLPMDIWMEIFLSYLAVATKPHPSRIISHVCRFWRFVALQSPLLWSKIVIPRAKLPHPTMTTISTYLSRTANISKLSLNIPQCPSWRFRFTSFAYEVNTAIQDYYDSPRGEAPGYAMYSFGNVDSLRLDTANLAKDPYFFISNWAIRQLECEHILPVLASSSASHLVKLSVTLTRWPINNTLERLLQLTSELQDLTIDYRKLSPIPELSFNNDQEEAEGEEKKQPAILLKLHSFQTTLPMLLKHVTTFASSPILEKIGILPTEGQIPSTLSPCSFEDCQKVLSKVPGLIARIRHFAVLSTTSTTITTTTRSAEIKSKYFEHGCLNLLLCFPNLRTIELNDAVAPELLFAMWGDERFRLGGKELVIRNCIVKPVLMFQLAETSCASDGGREKIKRVVLDRCEGITRAECERLKGLVGELVIYC